MAGVFKLKITETASELKTPLFQQKTAFGKERVQALYLLKLRKVGSAK
jgi:putative transposase